MKTNSSIIGVLFLIMGITSCNNYRTSNVVGSGDVVSMEVEVGEFIGVSVDKSLYVQVSGVGNVFYKGSSSLSSDISGVGNITSVGD